ncbi:uncharacterized protein B0H18DRAFT_157628 [Fomitopsis serialis]|uniref:uncharacterized protein n=1 Tax=Fomitopsis serialis TaxID=139415 RepID=UPI0020077B39|nr:uncharacterized protein B0H18DRAFT_157628 [Neoantrodia serialis]KAH9913767.1 hypothetical protein B0H18DRAFT_157628 [Neoantrodia serialis]
MSDKQDDSDSDALSNEIVRALGKELKRLRATHRDSEARIRDLEAQYGDLDARYSDLVARSSNLDARHNAVLARNTDLEGRNTELEGENARFQKELGDTRRALIATKVKEEDSEPCILAAGSPYEQAKRALDESMRQRKEERREHGHIVKSLQDKFAESDRRCAELARELVQAKRDLTLARQHVADTDSVAQSSSDDEGAPPVKARPPRYKAIVEKRMNDAEKTLSDSDVEGSDEGSDEESDRESDERSDAAPEESDDDESFTQLQDVDGFNLSHFLGNEAVNAFGVRESQVRVELPVKFKRQRALRALRKVDLHVLSTCA